MLVMSMFLYGADTWVAMDDRTMHKFSATVLMFDMMIMYLNRKSWSGWHSPVHLSFFIEYDFGTLLRWFTRRFRRFGRSLQNKPWFGCGSNYELLHRFRPHE